MEGDTSKLCCGCLAADRKIKLFQNSWKEQCFLGIIMEIVHSPPKNMIRLCWECEANITRIAKFKMLVQHSYEILNNFSRKSSEHRIKLTIDNAKETLPTDSLSPDTTGVENVTSKHRTKYTFPKLSIENVVDISLPSDIMLPDALPSYLNNTESGCIETVKHIKKHEGIDENVTANDKIKDEVDFSDDDAFLISKDDEQDYKVSTKKLKAKRCKKRKKEWFREIELTPEEIAEERKAVTSSEAYVNAMFRCESCVLAFPNEDDMNEHAAKKHELHASKHRCSVCACTFNTDVAFNYHTRRHARRYECFKCGVRTASKPHATNHYTTQHLHSVNYDLELKIYNKYGLEDKQQLTATKSNEKFPCEVCSKVFKWKTSLRKHLETHKIEAGQKRRPYCEACKLSFTTTSNLQKHVKTSSKHQIQLKLRKLKDDPDGVNTEQIAKVAHLVNKQRSLYACPQCDNAYQWRGNLLRHLQSHAARANGSLVCAPCDRVFASLATYNQHMRISKKHATENDFKYMCSDCGKKFSTKTKLREHVNWEHLKNFVHTCTDCQKVFKSHTSLYLHRQVVHKKPEERDLCDHCGKSFPNQTKMRAHIRAIHTQQAPYACATCGARFSWHSCLSRHLRRVHRDKQT